MTAVLDGLTLRHWQVNAIVEWEQRGRRGIVEAVTGTGKTAVGLAAVADGVSRGRRVLIVVPGVELMRQWFNAVKRTLPGLQVGRKGGGHHADMADVQVLIAVVQSAISPNFTLPGGQLLLVADEVHRYGAASFARVLSGRFAERLGLTATLERNDDGVGVHLAPYFENVINGCDYTRARADGIVAPIRVMTVGVPFTPLEYHEYQEIESRLHRERHVLIEQHGCREEPFGLFLADVEALTRAGSFQASRSAKGYLAAFSARKALLSGNEQKLDVLGEIGSVLALGGRSIVFSETKDSCESAAMRLRGRDVKAKAFTSDLSGIERANLLADFSAGRVSVLAAPRVLDEGIDVPEADLGVIIAGSKSRRQMIQRMGRVIRPKVDGRAATFVVLYMQGSIEDPARGAHEEFLGELLSVADSVVDLNSDTAAPTLAQWLDLSAEEVRESQSAPRVPALRAISDGQDVDEPVRPGEAARLLSCAAPGNDVAVLDRVLAVLSVLNAQQLRVIVERFGFGGARRHSVRETAKNLALDPHLVIRIEDEALARLAHPDIVDAVRDLAAIAERRTAYG